jgi:hypothetical protein
VNFSGAIGTYAISMRAAPTELQAEERILLTVRITATGRGTLAQIKRPDVRKLPQFARQFEIENRGERDLPQEKAREFDYGLRPRSAIVKQIPALPFIYFNPTILPPIKGYQTTYARAIPLIVKPRTDVTGAQVQGSSAPLDPPDPVLHVVSGSSVLRQEAPLHLPGWGVATLVLIPPLLCLTWLIAWRRLNPDAVRLAKQRRSRAARLALRSLGALTRTPPEEQALRIKEVLVDYLRERFDFTILEPTPFEVAGHLRASGVSDKSAGQARDFFAECDAARFAPYRPAGSDSWTARAMELLHALEEESWPAQAA